MGTTRVSEKTRKAILKRAKELNYAPNPLAVALKQGRKGAIGLFLHGVGSPGSELSQRFIQATGEAMIGRRANLLLRHFQSDDEFTEACSPELISKLDGLIVAGIAHACLAPRLQKLQDSGIHVVTACHDTLEGIPNFHTDSALQCGLPTKHLIEIGCSKIAHIKTDPKRTIGVKAALEEAGLKLNPKLVIQHESYNPEAGVECMQKLEKSKAKYDSIVCQSDAQACGVMRHLLNSGVPVKEWPKITGVDNSPIAKILAHIPITSTTSGMRRSAHLAVDAVFRKMEGEKVESQSLEPVLHIRQSTVPQ